MKKISNAYREAMNQKIRNLGYISVSLGIVNGDAQSSAQFSGKYAYWSNKRLPFGNDLDYIEYATLENNYMRVDGDMYFLPRNNEYMQLKNAPLTTNDIMGVVTVEFPSEMSIKGITIDFGIYYPSQFKIETQEKSITYDNVSNIFETSDVLGDTTYIKIIPITMINGDQRLRIERILMGIGITYQNNDVLSSSFEEYVNGVSNEIPYQTFDLTIQDKNNVYNVDDDNSFINFLETGQKVELSYGITLENNSIEWLKKATLRLNDWKSKNGEMSFVAKDIFDTMTDEYSLGYKIYERTAYQEAVSIFTDFGLEPDEYVIDDCLKDVVLNNPMQKGTHKECLQLLANACRCILFQDENGKPTIKANFANVIEPDDIQVESNNNAKWSNSRNVLFGGNNVYADLTRNFMMVDGSQYFLPKEDGEYVQTGYVTQEASDYDGLFTENPIITLKLPASYTYYGVYISFLGNPPKEMTVKTYSNDIQIGEFFYDDIKSFNLLNDEYTNFDTISFEITKAYPKNRVLIDNISFGDLSDYTITKDMMTSNPIGYAERKTKDLYVKIYTYENDENGEPKEIEDNIYYKKNVNNAGETKYAENPLISTKEHAKMVAEWIASYYSNNKSYEVEYRGDPAIDASDILFMDSDAANNLQVEVEKHNIDFNGAFSGSLELRRAMRMQEATL